MKHKFVARFALTADWAKALAFDWGEPYWESSNSTVMPDMVADEELRTAIDCFVNGRADLAQHFLNKCIEASGVPNHLDALEGPRTRNTFYPATLGSILLCHAYANWLLTNSLNRGQIARAARAYRDYCTTRGKGWEELRAKSSLEMARYTRAVRASIIAGDSELTSTLLKHDFKFKWIHKDEMDLWARLVAEWPKVSDKLRKDLEKMFDIIRDPDFDPGMVVHDNLRTAFEFAIIRQMYLAPGADPARDPDPAAVIEAYSR